MQIKEILKKNKFLRSTVKRIKNYHEFLSDAKDFSDNYIEAAESNGDYRYRLMLYIHNLEKGMCRDNPRPFGKEKVKAIIRIISNGNEKDWKTFEYQLAIAILKRWMEFFREKGWSVDKNIAEFICGLKEPVLQAGDEPFFKPAKELEYGGYSNVIFGRRSVRDFEDSALDQDDLDYAIKCFIAAPTACNRQMCKLYRIMNPEYKELLSKAILGISGFNISTTNLFIITYDVAAFEFYGERNQGYLNVGLAAMNFVNGLHARGIGSCFMQWSNKRSEDLFIRRKLGLSSSERIGIILGAGYYRHETRIPRSTRKGKELIYSVL